MSGESNRKGIRCDLKNHICFAGKQIASW